jgi:ABC-type branched-subunit amino acid transport system substrate-binding protein
MKRNRGLMAALATASFLLLSCAGGPRIQTTHSFSEEPAKTVLPAAPKTKIPARASSEAIYNAGRKLFESRDYNKSYDYFMAAAHRWQGTSKQLDAEVWASRSLIRANRYPECAQLTTQLLSVKGWTTANLSELTSYQFKSLEAMGDSPTALLVAAAAKDNPQLVKDSESYRLKAAEIIENKLSADQLQKAADDSRLENLRAGIYFRLGEISLDNKNQGEARSYFSKAISADPKSEYAQRAQDLESQLEAVRKVEPKTVGVILPLTGKYASIAQKTLRGIQMGLGLYNSYPSSFKLAVIDSEGNPDAARRGVERLVKEDNVISVIGSVLSKTAPAVASKTNELGVPSIALSQKSGITELGSNVFRNSLTSEMQVRYLVKVAMENLGMKKFAILYPNDPYGIEFTNIFWDEVLARGGSITAVQTYSPKETDFRDVIQRLVSTYYIEARYDEYKMRLKEWVKSLGHVTARTTPPDDLLPPIVDFDGIFIPDSAKSLGQIAAMLSFNNVKDVHLLGTNLWNVPGLERRAGSFANDLLFVDSFVSSDPNYEHSQFVKDYKTLFGEEPGILEIQGYDAALLLRQLISQGNTTRESLASALSRVQDFPGSLGPLSITQDREMMRPLTALTLEKGNVVPYRPSLKP